ncbi:MAG: hypothetical protein K0Q73_5879 [Paenibacillus sp.]|jgi:hypothetical protein|nr:hypothetical protein [Paenibacillus sp.]
MGKSVFIYLNKSSTKFCNLIDTRDCARVIDNALRFLLEENELERVQSSIHEGLDKIKNWYYDQEVFDDIEEIRTGIQHYIDGKLDEFYQPTDSFERSITQAHLERRNAVWKKEHFKEKKDGTWGYTEYLYKPSDDVY